MNLTATVEKRAFPDVINEWTDTLLKVNREAVSPAEIVMTTRLGLLGQRLIYEAYALGENRGLQLMREGDDNG